MKSYISYIYIYEILLNVIKTIGKRKKEDGTFLRRKTEQKQNSITIMMSVDEKGRAFPVKLKLEEELFE